MIATTEPEIQDVLSRVALWPAADRIVLARRILETVEASPSRRTRGMSAEDVIALLKVPQPAPDDAECRRIVEEERLKKYGP